MKKNTNAQNGKVTKSEGRFEIRKEKHVPKSKVETLMNTASVYDEKHGLYKAMDFTSVRFVNEELDYIKALTTKTIKTGKYEPILGSLNRAIDNGFVKKIRKAFLIAKDSTLTSLVLVYTNIFSKTGEYELVIADGQHRIMAFNSLRELYLEYVEKNISHPEKYPHPGGFDYALIFKVVPISTIEEFVKLIVTLNSVSHNFKEANYIHTYSALGVPAYRNMAILLNELEQTELPKYSIKIQKFPIELLRIASPVTIGSDIRKGKAEFDYEIAKENIKYMLQLMEAINISTVRPGRSILEIIKLSGYRKNHSVFMKYLNNLSDRVKKQAFKDDEKEMAQKLKFHYDTFLDTRKK